MDNTMDKQQIIAGNEAIAKFMGLEQHQDIYGLFYLDRSSPNRLEWLRPSSLKYHEDWNLLMPVYKKVSALERTNEPIWDIIAAKLALAVLNADIEKVWLNCTTLIKLKETENPHRHGT